jgi:prevent-host-death family protein
MMGSWPVQDAKARFSELLERCLSEGPQTVTKRGVEAAVLVPAQEWHRMKQSARPGLKELLLGDGPRFDLELSSRRRFRRRAPVALD